MLRSYIPDELMRTFARIGSAYRALFSIQEIERSVLLQWLFGAMLFFFYVTFYQWISSTQLTYGPGAHGACWPYFQTCEQLRFLMGAPYGYSQNIFFMGLFALLVFVVYCMWKKWWTGAHAVMLGLLVWKYFASFVLAWGISGVYDYYHIILTSILLLVPHKEYFTKIAFVLLYFLSATVKFYPTWILGTYFTTLELGLPIFPRILTVPLSQSVIISQIFGCWFLLSRRPLYQRLALLYFSVFHFYSGTLVAYNYPSIAETSLLILFGPFYRHQWAPLTKSALAGWAAIALLFVFQMPGNLVPGDEKLTMQGYRFGMWMFDANHQCVATFLTHYKKDAEGMAALVWQAPPGYGCPGSSCMTKQELRKEGGEWVREVRVESPRAEIRCDPYTFWKRYQWMCGSERAERVAMQFDHSINGSPFYRIVDVPDMCSLQYSTFGKNSWIQEPPDAPAVGVPVQNIYY